MKLLGWMHRKLNHSPDSLKTSPTENHAFLHTTFGEQGHHADPNFRFAQSKLLNFKCQSLAIDIKPNKVEDIGEEESASDLFHGFLAIGTLGLEPLNTEPPTPTFPKTMEDVTYEEMQITENELKLINDKLEKLLEAEAEDNSNKTSERSSHASIITLSNDQTEEANTEDHGNMVICPLQRYLFGSSIELSETEVQIKKEKTSLGELFKRNKVHEYPEGTYENEDHQAKENEEKQATGKYATNFMKKMMKMIHSTSRTFKVPNADTGHCALIKSALPKVLKIFKRRVHPERLMVNKKLTRSYTKKIEKIFCKCGYEDEEREANTTLPQRTYPTKEINSLEPYFDTTSSIPFISTGEHWIKTDADYLVLEL